MKCQIQRNLRSRGAVSYESLRRIEPIDSFDDSNAQEAVYYNVLSPMLRVKPMHVIPR